MVWTENLIREANVSVAGIGLAANTAPDYILARRITLGL